jgi:excisionase family DNA binding protein
MMEPLKSIEEAAEIWGVSPWTVRAYVRQGKIRPVRIGRRVLIEATEVLRLIEEGRSYAPHQDQHPRNGR